MEKKILMVAIDGGPCQVMKGLEDLRGYELFQSTSNRSFNFSSKKLEEMLVGYDACLVGTSGSNKGTAIESLIRKTATRISLPLIVIEDYPGNYRHVESGVPKLLIVEHGSVPPVHHKRWGEVCPDMVVIPNPRYDKLRKQFSVHCESTKIGWSEQRNSPNLLWAGQPETTNSLKTLERLLEVLLQFDVQLLFKAHPRDPGYPAAYRPLLESKNIRWIDITPIKLMHCIERFAPRAVLTQFSSVAIETGFYGIPSAHVLYENLGGKQFMEDKYFDVPPWCEAGASMLVRDSTDHLRLLHDLLFDEQRRCYILDCFTRFWGTEPSAIKIIDYINKLLD